MIHKLTTTSTTDAAVSFICPEDTVIEAIRWVIHGTASGDASYLRCELSFQPTGQLTINETVNVIDEAAIGSDLVTSGVATLQVNDYHTIPGGVAVEAGEKLYLNNTGNLITHRTTVFLYTSARRSNKSSFRRR